jgi:hypothetical protein
MTLKTTTLNANAEYYYVDYRLCSFTINYITQVVFMLSVFMLSVFMLSVFMLSVFMLSGFMLKSLC